MPQVKLVQADLLGDWTKEIPSPFDRIVSAYVLHEFSLEEKITILQKSIANCLLKDGYLVIADIAFPDREIRTAAYQYWADVWDEEEYYWAADETRIACEHAGLHATYEQVSICGGVFTIKRKGTN